MNWFHAEWHSHQQQLADQLREKVRIEQSNIVDMAIGMQQVVYISDVVNRPDYVPRNPSAEDLANVFDTRFPTVQPYLHRVNCSLDTKGGYL